VAARGFGGEGGHALYVVGHGERAERAERGQPPAKFGEHGDVAGQGGRVAGHVGDTARSVPGWLLASPVRHKQALYDRARNSRSGWLKTGESRLWPATAGTHSRHVPGMDARPSVEWWLDVASTCGNGPWHDRLRDDEGVGERVDARQVSR
jgi:hypothetical protein